MNETAALLFYAADMGFYDKGGVHVNASVFGNSGAISSAIAAGAIAVGSFAISVGALARQHGVPLVLIAPAGLYLSTTPTSGLIVRKDSPYFKAADLNGKTIAVRDLANMSYYGAKQWMDKNGGDSKSVKWIEIPDTSVVPALQAGRFEAASISEPALGDAVHGGDMRSLASVFDAIGKRFLISGTSPMKTLLERTRTSSGNSPVSSTRPRCRPTIICRRVRRSWKNTRTWRFRGKSTRNVRRPAAIGRRAAGARRHVQLTAR